MRDAWGQPKWRWLGPTRATTQFALVSQSAGHEKHVLTHPLMPNVTSQKHVWDVRGLAERAGWRSVLDAGTNAAVRGRRRSSSQLHPAVILPSCVLWDWGVG